MKAGITDGICHCRTLGKGEVDENKHKYCGGLLDEKEKR